MSWSPHVSVMSDVTMTDAFDDVDGVIEDVESPSYAIHHHQAFLHQQQHQRQQQQQHQQLSQHSRSSGSNHKKKHHHHHRRVRSSSSITSGGGGGKKTPSGSTSASAAAAGNSQSRSAPRRTSSAEAASTLGASVASSALEYSLSDTSEADEQNQQQQQQHQRQSLSKSRFRLREDANVHSSMRTVRFLNYSGDEKDYQSNSNVSNAGQAQKEPPTSSSALSSAKRQHATSRSHAQQHTQQQQRRTAGAGRKQATTQQQHHHQTRQKNKKGTNWMTQLAYSFRSPSPPVAHKQAKRHSSTNNKQTHEHQHQHHHPVLQHKSSSEFMEYPHYQQHRQAGISLAGSGLNRASTSSSSAVIMGEGEEKKQQQQQPPPPPPPPPPGGATSSSSLLMTTPYHRESDPLLLGSSIISREDVAAQRQGTAAAIAVGRGGPADESEQDDYDDDDDDPRKNYIAVAASFLQDYEGGRAPTLSTHLSTITNRQISLYQFKFGNAHIFSNLLSLATLALFVSSFLEGFFVPSVTTPATAASTASTTPLVHRSTLSTAVVTSVQVRRTLLTVLNFFAILIFGVDIWFRRQICGPPLPRRRQRQQQQQQQQQQEEDEQHRKNQQQFPKLQNQRRDSFFPDQYQEYQHHWNERHTRQSRSERLVKPIMLLGIVLALENIARLMIVKNFDPTNKDIVMFSSVFKPLVLFYVSSRARNAAEALRRIIRIVARVLIMELLLILMFAAVACRLFREYANFQDLSTAWLSLFELSTTVVNPSVWMPVYQKIPLSALFFIFFVVTAVFYLHSLVLSVVFQTFVHAAGVIHDRSATDREDAIQLAYMALQRQQQRQDWVSVSAYGGYGRSATADGHSHAVDIEFVRETLQIVRPHYSEMKINALIEIVDPSNQGSVDLVTFRTKIRQALNASIRTARSPTRLATSIELIAVFVAVVNFIYVMLVSSRFETVWFNAIQVDLGAMITLVAGFELLIRFNPLRIPDFTPLTRLNATFDGIALVAALISSIGIVLFVTGRPNALEYILTGRAIDIFRVMRFFGIFRDVVQRSSDVLPALVGPVVLVITMLHIFVYTGLALWGGAVPVGQQEERYFLGQITYLYDLNNFNSYAEGAVTMFQVLVVNDWHAIAQVFLYAERMSSPYIVYPFFIAGNLVGVSILLNVLTAFFVESFVTKVDDGSDSGGVGSSGGQNREDAAMTERDRDYSILVSQNNSLKRIKSRGIGSEGRSARGGASKRSREVQVAVDDQVAIDHGADADSEGSSEDLYEFDVFEREGFDKIMQTVAGCGQDHDFARQVCSYFEVFESLVPGREMVGYLVCDQQTLERYGNRRFQTRAEGFLSENELNVAVSDMHSELLALSARPTFSNDRALIRSYPHRTNPDRILEISASLLRRHPAVSLFCSRTKRSSPATSSSQVVPE